MSCGRQSPQLIHAAPATRPAKAVGAAASAVGDTGEVSTLVARGVRASFADVPVLHGVDVVVGPGTRLGLVGPNGAGKSTLLRALVGAVPLDGGTISVTGTVGYLPQEPD